MRHLLATIQPAVRARFVTRVAQAGRAGLHAGGRAGLVAKLAVLAVTAIALFIRARRVAQW
ncbi:MAG: hypothetical protein HY691_20440 [Chloroflexi bacterium]|nr:hypothetical protein [Chloroflexota bacterium]